MRGAITSLSGLQTNKEGKFSLSDIKGDRAATYK